MNILLVQPQFPISPKSRNHKNFLPIGLLKIASFLTSQNTKVKLLHGCPADSETYKQIIEFKPDEVWITSLFTYWSKYVKDTVSYYRSMLPNAKIIVGGIYASLMPEHCKEYTACDEVYTGIMEEAEKCIPAYDLVKNNNKNSIDYQIIHASRGCQRECSFCGVWRIEPAFKPKRTIKNEIICKKIVFYDNNFLYNPYIEGILEELISLKENKQIDWCESQSGFDGRILMGNPHLAKMLKQAGFRYPRIAWDWYFKDEKLIKKQIDLLHDAGYQTKDVYVFMLYNWDLLFEEMERKRIKCWEWQVQIADCRYRPLNQTFDRYNPMLVGQTPDEYHIHLERGWNDTLIKQFRRNVRRQNICVRHNFPFYSKTLEHKNAGTDIMNEVKLTDNIDDKIDLLNKSQVDYWFPKGIT